MIQESELATLIMGGGALVAAMLFRRYLGSGFYFSELLAVLAVLLCAWVATILEGLFWPVVMNCIEHLCYAASSILLAVWVRRVLKSKENPA